MRVALFRSLMIAFFLYRYGTFDDQWTGNFLSLRLTSVLVLPLLKTIFVPRKISGFTSQWVESVHIRSYSGPYFPTFRPE